jgi:arylsulfatase A-like enzyme
VRIAFLAALVLAAPPRAAEKPNFVLVLIDDLGWADAESDFFETPNLDRLAAGGMKFTNAYAACPVCSPTRASLMTGKYPARVGITDWIPGRKDMPSQKLLRPPMRNELPLEERTLAEALRERGYATAHVGKWHLGGEAYLPEKHGFDVNIAGTHAGSPPGGYFTFKTPTFALKEGEYLDGRLTDEAIRWVRENKEKPFFLYLAHYTVHIPLQPRKDLLARFEAKAKKGGPRENPHYAAMVASMDESVGRVVRALEELGLDRKTVVVFTSDNGGLSVKEGPNTPATSNAPLRAGKGHLHEGGIRVPWIVSWPGTVRPGVCDVPVVSPDLFSTFVELAGGKPGDVDGLSLAGLLMGGPPPAREAIYWHYPHYSNQGGKPGGAVRMGDWKIVEPYEDFRVELYNLKDDPSETTNLAGTDTGRAKAMAEKLDAWRKSVGAKMPTPNPEYKAK